MSVKMHFAVITCSVLVCTACLLNNVHQKSLKIPNGYSEIVNGST